MTKRRATCVGIFVTALLVGIYFGVFNGFPYQPLSFALAQSPMTAYRIAGSERSARDYLGLPNTEHGYPIVQQQIINDPQWQHDVIGVLNNGFTYGGNGARCFDPGFAFRIGDGDQAIDVVICFGCSHVYFYQNGKTLLATSMSPLGDYRLKQLYRRAFPGHSPDAEDDDAKEAREARANQWERRFGVTSFLEPATAP